MKRKTLWIIGILVIFLIAAGAGAFWWMSQQPLYNPGMVRAGQNLRAPLTPPAQPAEADFWQVEPDIRLYHFSEGTGRNVLVVHGGPGLPFRESMAGVTALTGEYRFNYYDQRGCGKSTHPFDRLTSQNMYENMTTLDRTLGLGAQIADIERIRQILGDEKLILIGHSWGGLLASLYAAEFPEHVEKLVLISPANMLVMPEPNAESDLFASVRAKLPQDQVAGYDAFMKDYMDFNKLFTRSEQDLIDMDARFGGYYMSVVNVPEDKLVQQGEPGGWMTWAMYISMGQRHDYRDLMRKVTAPVLVVHGSADLQSEKASRMYSDTFPNAQFTVIQDVGHFSFQENPNEFSGILREFLTK